ncbi:MAG TPA: VOC family protein [Thermomonas sp.]|nr:VOC family protein [Thermomonas sp.]
MSASNPVGWFEIYTDDLARARAFYETVLGVTLEPLPLPGGMDGFQMLAFPSTMENPGAGGTLCRMEGVSPGPGGTLVYFTCADCAVEAGRVEAAGGRLQQAKMSIGDYGNIALAFDTEGNMFGLHSMG